MAKPRKKWRVEPDRAYMPSSFPSETKAYEYVRTILTTPLSCERITVLVDIGTGRGWDTYEIHEKGREF